MKGKEKLVSESIDNIKLEDQWEFKSYYKYDNNDGRKCDLCNSKIIKVITLENKYNKNIIHTGQDCANNVLAKIKYKNTNCTIDFSHNVEKQIQAYHAIYVNSSILEMKEYIKNDLINSIGGNAYLMFYRSDYISHDNYWRLWYENNIHIKKIDPIIKLFFDTTTNYYEKKILLLNKTKFIEELEKYEGLRTSKENIIE